MDINGKKILVITTTDNMIWQFLIPHIEYLQKEGAQVECACNETDFFFEELKTKYSFKVHKFNFTRFPFTPKNLKAFSQLKKFVKENHFDLIYCHQPVGGVFGRMIAKKFKIPVIYIAHGFHFFKGCPKKNILYKIIEKHYSRYTNALVTMNEEDYQAAKSFKAKRVYKINGVGVDLTKYKRNTDLDEIKLREEFGFKKDDFIIISVAEFTKNKNIITAIKAIEQTNNKNVKLLLCGRGALKEELEQYVKEHNLQSQVVFAGYRKDITNCIQISNSIILISFREGLPKSIMEAMALSKPAIVSNTRGSRDLLASQGGYIVEPTDTENISNCIQDLVHNPQKCEDFGIKNYNFIQQYDLKVVLNQLKNIFEDI